MSAFYQTVTLISIAFLLHSGYSETEHFHEVQNKDQFAPLDIQVQAYCSLLLALFGLVGWFSSQLKNIQVEEQIAKTPMTSVQEPPSFRFGNHRGRFLFK
jgi:hypothetical protein